MGRQRRKFFSARGFALNLSRRWLGALDFWMFFNGSHRFVFWFDLPQRHWNHILLVAITPRSEQCDCESEADKMNQR
jgi:hypothetical protein